MNGSVFRELVRTRSVPWLRPGNDEDQLRRAVRRLRRRVPTAKVAGWFRYAHTRIN